MRLPFQTSVALQFDSTDVHSSFTHNPVDPLALNVFMLFTHCRVGCGPEDERRIQEQLDQLREVPPEVVDLMV
jgi:hypothetical protein